MDVSAKLAAYLFSQWRESTNINAIIDMITDIFQDTDDVCNFILDGWSIDDAEGEQLDLLGGLIGVQRPPAQETRLFTICDLGEISPVDSGFKIEEEIAVYFASSGYSVGDIGATVVVRSGGSAINHAEITSFTSTTEIGITKLDGNFLVGQKLELELDALVFGYITDIDYYPGTSYRGGYVGDIVGLRDQSDVTANASDEYFRFIIRQKAKSFKSRMSRYNLFDYLLTFGARCKIDDDTTHNVEVDPVRWQDFDDWTRNYILKKGFKPAGIRVFFTGNTRQGDSI